MAISARPSGERDSLFRRLETVIQRMTTAMRMMRSLVTTEQAAWRPLGVVG